MVSLGVPSGQPALKFLGLRHLPKALGPCEERRWDHMAAYLKALGPEALAKGTGTIRRLEELQQLVMNFLVHSCGQSSEEDISMLRFMPNQAARRQQQTKPREGKKIDVHCGKQTKNNIAAKLAAL
eukprot:1137710-Pelagomonas_calceolata.AAC.1